jgi:hypothetical protein
LVDREFVKECLHCAVDFFGPGKRPLGKTRRMWEFVIRMDLWEIRLAVDVEYIQLDQDRDWWWALVNAVMNLQIMSPWS